MWHDANGMGWWMLWGVFMMIFFWGGLIALVIWAVRSFTGGTDAGSGAGTAREKALSVVEERYARGEISRDEFIQIKSDLTAGA